MPSRTAVGIWLDSVTSRRPVPASGSAMTTRGSMEAGARRWFSSSSRTVCAAAAKAAAQAAASPWRISAATLSGACAHSWGAPSDVAACTSVTAGSTS